MNIYLLIFGQSSHLTHPYFIKSSNFPDYPLQQKSLFHPTHWYAYQFQPSRLCLTIHQRRRCHVPLPSFQFLQSYHKVSLIKVCVKSEKYAFLVTLKPWGALDEEKLYIHYNIKGGEAKQAMNTKTSISVSSPPQCWSQAIVCFSTPRMYPQGGYFLVRYNRIHTHRHTLGSHLFHLQPEFDLCPCRLEAFRLLLQLCNILYSKCCYPGQHLMPKNPKLEHIWCKWGIFCGSNPL